MHFSAILASTYFNLWILWRYPESLESAPFPYHHQDEYFLIWFMRPVPALLLGQHIFSFLFSRLFFVLSLHDHSKKMRKELHMRVVALAGYKCHFSLSCQLVFVMLPILAESEWTRSSKSFDPSSRTKLLWVMTYSIFPPWNTYCKIPRKILFRLSCNSRLT